MFFAVELKAVKTTSHHNNPCLQRFELNQEAPGVPGVHQK